MQDNELDKLINDAANQHHPPYDDEAWGKMAALLDKHLPQKKDRRRPFVFWLLFLLLGSAVLLGILQPWKDATTTAAGNKAGNMSVAPPSSQKSPDTITPPATDGTGTPAGENAVTANDLNGPETNTPAANPSVKATQPYSVQTTGDENVTTAGKSLFTAKGKSAIKIKRPAAVAENGETAAEYIAKQKQQQREKNTTPVVSSAKENVPAVTEKPAAESENTTAPATINTASEKNELPAKKDSAAAKQNPVTAAVSKKEKKDRRFSNNFALTISTGADMSFIELNNPGKVQPLYGAGAAYTIGKRLKISSGLYVSKKVYDAAPYQYKFPNGATYPNLKEINADCNIYEIPLNVYYNFKQHKKHNWFAGAGLSSLLMKKEHYNYQYKTPAGQWYSYARTVTNENNHYFSVVTLSGGYQYKLSNRIALVAEPYVKLPLGGVGAGKIKLNSSGILVTAAIKPFATSKK